MISPDTMTQSVCLVSVLDSLEAYKQAHGSGQLHQLGPLALHLQQLLQDGLVGNRTVSSGDVWGLVTAATRAFPIQLSPSVEKAQEMMAAGAGEGDMLSTWIMQAAADGSLAVLLQKLCSQPQILTAYARDAPLRQAATAEQLLPALQELQASILVSPYDKCVQAKAAATSTPAQQPVRIQTELDLPQQQQHAPAVSSTGSAAGGSRSNGSSTVGSSSNLAIASNAASGQLNAGSQPPPPPQQQQQRQAGLVERLRSARMPQLGSFSRKAPQQQQQQQEQGQQQQQQQQGQGDPAVQVRLLVTPTGQLDATQERLVQLQLLVLPVEQQQLQQQQQQGHTGQRHPQQDGTSVESVQGLMHSLKQTATSGLQQSAAAVRAAAGQDISDAVAAAGGAVAAAIAKPMGAVKSFNRFRAGRTQQQQQQLEQHPRGASREDKHPANNSSSTAAGDTRHVCSSNEHSPRGSGDGKAGAGSMAQSTPTGSSSSSTEAFDRLVAVQLLLRPPEDSASLGPIQLVLSTLPATGGVAGREGWSTRGLLDRLRLTRGETSSSTGSDRSAGQKQQQQQQRQRGKQRPQGQHSEQAGQGVATVSTGAEQQQQEQQEQADDPLEGDMWSVMSRLTSATLVPKKAADGSAAGDPAVPDAVAAALQASAQGLQAKLLSCCQAVCTAAADATGPLGEDSPAVLELLELLQGLLNHGLRSSSTGGSASANTSSTPAAGTSGSSSRGTTPEPGGAAGSSGVAAAVKVAASARDMLGGLLHGRQQSAFRVLQALQHGSKQQPRLMLGADGIANMKATKAAAAAVKLDLWVRASLNEQLLGVRMSTLLANPEALKQWYHPQALLLQHEAMVAVMQQLQEVAQHRFVLPVESAAGAGRSPAAATAAASQHQGPALAAATPGSTTGITASGVASALDPRKYLGGFSTGFGSLRAGSATGPTAAAAAAAAGSAGPPAAAGSSGSTTVASSMPTFMWGAAPGGQATSTTAAATGSSGAAAPAAAPAAPAAAAAAAVGGFFSRRRVAPIKELRVPAPGAGGGGLSREPSSTLSPMSADGDAAYAEWWSPNNSLQDLAAAAAGESSSSSAGQAQARRLGSSSSLRSVGSTRSAAGLSGRGEVGCGTPKSAAAALAAAAEAVAGDGGMLRSASRQSRAESEVSTGATSEAALQLEHDLQAAMAAPMLVGQFSRRSSSGGSGGGVSGLRRNHSAGWDAAFAAARARAGSTSGAWGVGGGVGAGTGMISPSGVGTGVVGLSRRSRSPDGGGDRGGPLGSSRGRQSRHMHKRSSSLNDLPELEVLWKEGHA